MLKRTDPITSVLGKTLGWEGIAEFCDYLEGARDRKCGKTEQERGDLIIRESTKELSQIDFLVKR